MAGCAHVRTDDVKLGEGVTTSPSWATVKQAAVETVADPRTWAPALVGAAAQRIANTDMDIPGDTRQENALSGSGRRNAADTGDWLRLGALGLYVGLELVAASGPEDSGEWRRSRFRGFLNGVAAMGVAAGNDRGYRSVTGPIHLNREYHHNLASGHASTTTAAIRLANTMGYDEMNRSGRFAAHTGLVDVDAWERVKAGKYKPSEVFLGNALGNFISGFTRAAFLRPVLGESVGFTVDWLPGGSVLKLYLDY